MQMPISNGPEMWVAGTAGVLSFVATPAYVIGKIHHSQSVMEVGKVCGILAIVVAALPFVFVGIIGLRARFWRD